MAGGATMSRRDPARFAGKRARPLVRAALAQGWRVEVTGGNHLRLLPPHGRPVFMAATPSDHRSVLNARATLRRAGLEV